MGTPALTLNPDQANYVAPQGHTVVSTMLDGGASRYRADQQGAVSLVVVEWTCNATNYNYLLAFYRTAIAFGSLPFTISLILDSNIPQVYVARFVPDTFGLTSTSGQTYIVGATLEVTPNPAYAAGDAAIIAAGPDHA